MVALVAGNSLGLNLTSLATLGARGVAGNATLGRGTDRVTVNVANGNLILQNQDDALAGPGLWSASQRTYNSQEHLAGDFRLPGLQPPRLATFGAIGQRNSSIVRKDADGSEDRYAYDATDAEGHVSAMEYDANGNQVLQRDAAGNVIARSFDAQNQLLTETLYVAPDPDSAGPARASQPQTTHTIYDAGKRNHVRFIVSPEGRVTEYRYNATGQRIVALRYAAAYRDSSAWQVAYPQALPPTPLGLGAPVSAGGYMGAAPTEAMLAAWAAAQDSSQVVRTDYRYDFRGQLQQQLRYPVVPDDGSLNVATAGGANPNLYASTIGNGNSVGNGTGNGNANGKGNGVGNAIDGNVGNGIGNANGNGNGKPGAAADITQYVYDAFGRLLQTVSPNGGVTSYAYDGLNRLLAMQDAEGNFTATRYDDASRRTTLQSANGLSTVSAFDAAGRLTSLMQTDVSGQPLAVTTYDYDADGRLRHGTDPTGVERWMLYDEASRLVAEIDGNRSLIEYVYDHNNQLLQTIRHATPVSYTPEEQVQDYTLENNRFSSALANRASDPTNLAAAQRYLSMYPMASNEGINVWLPESMPVTGNDADVTPSDLMRFEKASYQQGDFNKLDITGKRDTMGALFLKNYGYAPMPAELIQYGNYNNLSNVNDVSINREIVSPSLEQLRNTPITEAQLQTFAADDASYAQARLAAQARAASSQGPMTMPGPMLASDYEAQGNQLGRNAHIFANAAQWAYGQGNRQAGDTYQQLANNAYYAGQRASITALNMNAVSQRALSIPTPNFDPAPGWSYMGQNSAGLPGGGTAQSDFVVLGGTSLSGSGSIALNVRDGTTYLAGGVTQSDPRSIGWKPGLVATAGWIFGSNSAEGTNNFLNGNGNQAYVSVPTPWKVNGFVAVTHAYGGGYALELGVASPGNLSAGVVPISHSKVIYSPK